MAAIDRLVRFFFVFAVAIFSIPSSGQDYSAAARAKAELHKKFSTEIWWQIWEDYVRVEYLGLKSVEMNGDIAVAWSKVAFHDPLPLPIGDDMVDIYGGYNYNEFNCKNNTIANRVVITAGRNNDYQAPIISKTPQVEQIESGSNKDRLLTAVCYYGKTGKLPDIDAEITAKNGRRAFEYFIERSK